jgi:hypothetical protein
VTRLFVLVLKHIFERGLGGHLDEILALAAEVIRQPTGMTMVVALLRYLGRILARRFPTNEAQLQQLEQQLAKITDEAVLNELADAALDVLVLSDFVTRLQRVVPVS